MGFKIIGFMIFSFGLVAFAGLYGILYTLERLKNLPRVLHLSYVFGVSQLVCSLYLLSFEIVSAFWRILIFLSGVLYLFLPPFWLLFIRKFH